MDARETVMDFIGLQVKNNDSSGLVLSFYCAIFWFFDFLGRVDDVINPSGHRIGTAEIESALVACPQVSEAAVVGFPHEIKGEGIGCFVILR